MSKFSGDPLHCFTSYVARNTVWECLLIYRNSWLSIFFYSNSLKVKCSSAALHYMIIVQGLLFTAQPTTAGKGTSAQTVHAALQLLPCPYWAAPPQANSVLQWSVTFQCHNLLRNVWKLPVKYWVSGRKATWQKVKSTLNPHHEVNKWKSPRAQNSPGLLHMKQEYEEEEEEEEEEIRGGWEGGRTAWMRGGKMTEKHT